MRNINSPWPKSTQFWQWSGIISIWSLEITLAVHFLEFFPNFLHGLFGQCWSAWNVKDKFMKSPPSPSSSPTNHQHSAAEIQSPGHQIRPMNPPGDPRSYHRWSVWRPMDSLGFSENVLEWKWRDDSTDALISNVHCALVKFGPVWSILTIFY